MITKLTFIEFGKFKSVGFPLAPVTLVYGPNEAGKTTFFDGLLQAICSPSETKKSGKLLKLRYGAGRQVLLEATEPVSISDDEFLNLYAIRAGDLNLELNQGSDWMEKLKSTLFHGGLDPKILVDEFEKLSSDKKNFVHNRKLEEIKTLATTIRSDLDGRRRERESLLVKEKTLADLEIEWQGIRNQALGLEAKLKDFDLELVLEDKVAQRQKISSLLKRWEEWKSLTVEQKELSIFSHIKRQDWDDRVEAERKAVSKVQIEQGKRDQQADQVKTARSALRTLKEAQGGASKRSQVALSLIEGLRQIRSEKTRANRPRLLGIMAAVLLLGLAALSLSLLPHLLGLGITTALIGMAFASAYSGYSRYRFLAWTKPQESLARFKEQWNLANHSGRSLGDHESPTENLSLEGFLEYLEGAAKEGEHLERQEQQDLQRLHGLEQALEFLDASLLTLHGQVDATRLAERQWLETFGLTSGEQLLQKLSRMADLLERLPKRLDDLLSQTELQDPLELGLELHRKLKVLDEEGIPIRVRDEASLQRFRRERADLHQQRDTLANKEREILLRREGLAGEIRGALGNMASVIVDLEFRLGEAETLVRNRELDKRASILALEIFKNIGTGADLLLKGLAQEMQAMLANILPKERSLALPSLTGNEMEVEDAGGEKRNLENLSTGTRDAVVLAAKLALALKSRVGPGILVLDEPFLALDEARQARALELLRNFHNQHGWQVILLSKERQLRDKLSQIFSDPLIVELP